MGRGDLIEETEEFLYEKEAFPKEMQKFLNNCNFEVGVMQPKPLAKSVCVALTQITAMNFAHLTHRSG